MPRREPNNEKIRTDNMENIDPKPRRPRPGRPAPARANNTRRGFLSKLDDMRRRYPVAAHIIYIALAILCLVIILSFGLDWGTRHGKSIVVPNFVGMDISEAEREAERERIRAERRAKLGDVADPSTSKKKLAAREKAEKGPVIEGKLTPEQREALKTSAAEEQRGYSGIEDRPYARGRAYKPVRYGRDTSGPGGYDMTDELRAEADAEAVPDGVPEDDAED